MSLQVPPDRILPPAEIDCKWWKAGYCARGKKCYFRHDEAMAGIDTRPNTAGARVNSNGKANAKVSPPAVPEGSSLSDTPPAQICTICLETPDTFGLLLNCDHVFCLECIRDWRSSTRAPLPSNEELKDATKTCPLCRAHSEFIIPSSKFPAPPSTKSPKGAENPAKKLIVDRYLERLKNIPCRYFEESVEGALESMHDFRPKCRFGNGCHYAHKNPVTKEPYIFSAEELSRSRRRPRQRRPSYSAEDMAMIEVLFSTFGSGYDSDRESGCDDDFALFEGSPVRFGFGADLDFDFQEFEHSYGWD